MLAVGATLLVAAGLWVVFAVPALVKFPSHLDQTTSYAGTFKLYVDPASGQALPNAITLPLRIDRRVHTLPGGGAHTAVVEEAVTYRIGDTTQQERHHYVIDRRSMQNRSDPRSWSFAPENHTDPAGTYRITLPMGTKATGRYRIWENEPGSSFWMSGDPARARVRSHGLALVGLQEVWARVPVASYYRAQLSTQGFPLDLTFDQLAARLGAEGVDVERALAALPPADGPAVAAARAAKLPLRFFRDNDGHALVEPRTGEIVDLVYSDEAISAAPDLAPLAPLRAALGRAPASPDVTALAAGLDTIDRAAPTRVYEIRYEQTPASFARSAARAKDDLRQIVIVERDVPGGLAGLGLLAFAAAGIGWWRARHATRAPAATAAPEGFGHGKLAA